MREGIKLWELLIVWLIIAVPLGVGWVMNLVNVINNDIEATGICIVRIIGVVVVPLGSVMGFLS
jgi:hypothetical protein